MGWPSKLVIVASVAVAVGILAFGVYHHTEGRVREEAAALEEQLLSARKEALEHQVNALLNALGALHRQGGESAARQELAKVMLSGVRYGENGYLFVYDGAGTCIVHSGDPEIVGRVMDGARRRVVLPLLTTARQGGGFRRYRWPRPGSRLNEEKISYVSLFKPWDWTVGTGDYLDDIARAGRELREREIAKVRTDMAWVGAMGALALAIVFAGVFVPYLRGQRRAREREIEVVMAEQGRIASELHDDVAQAAFAAGYEVKAAKERVRAELGTIPQLDDALAMIETTQRKVREVAHALYVPEFEDGLGVTLAGYLRDFGTQTRLKVDLETRGEILALAKPVAFELYRITQELLANVWRHANAKSVKVSVSVTGRQVQLCVLDDGQGFAGGYDANSPGIGLRHVRTRARHLGGTHTIQSRPGETMVLVTVPFYRGENA